MSDPAREFIVHTDASAYATGAVLMQQFESGLRHTLFSCLNAPRMATLPQWSRDLSDPRSRISKDVKDSRCLWTLMLARVG